MSDFDCNKCQYHRKAFSEELGEYVHACTYISKTTAWACCEDEGEEHVQGQ